MLYGDGDPLTGGSPYAILRSALRRHPAWPADHGRDERAAAAHRFSLVAISASRAKAHADRHPGRALWRAVSRRICRPARRAAQRSQDHERSDRRCVLALFSSLAAQAPLVLVLEDLLVGGCAVGEAIGDGAQDLGEQPILILGLARPEVQERFSQAVGRSPPARDHAVRSAEEGLREAHRRGAGQEPVARASARLIEQAAGNTLYLEELIRAAAGGQTTGQPATVLAMLQGASAS